MRAVVRLFRWIVVSSSWLVLLLPDYVILVDWRKSNLDIVFAIVIWGDIINRVIVPHQDSSHLPSLQEVLLGPEDSSVARVNRVTHIVSRDQQVFLLDVQFDCLLTIVESHMKVIADNSVHV